MQDPKKELSDYGQNFFIPVCIYLLQCLIVYGAFILFRLTEQVCLLTLSGYYTSDLMDFHLTNYMNICPRLIQ